MSIDRAVFQTGLAFARQMDVADPLQSFREMFCLPVTASGEPVIYLAGNSLGLQPKQTGEYVQQELDKWRQLGVRGHFEGDYPWMPYHEFLTEPMAELVGGLPHEVVMMNSLTVNLHLMFATFYRPTPQRHQILIEHQAFPSDFHAVESQIRWHGFDPPTALVMLTSSPEQPTIEWDDIADAIERHRDSLAMILLPGVQYYTGQVYPMERIAALARRYEIPFGLDLAHAAGNVPLQLHQWDVDFAVWCSYKYLNSGPGSVGGCFIHERHCRDTDLVRLAGWWGHDKQTRFLMKNEFQAIPTAEGWQISNPPILSLAAIRAALDVFIRAGGMVPLREKSIALTGYLEWLLDQRLGPRVKVITPVEQPRRGCQLSLTVQLDGVEGRDVHRRLEQSGVECDWREPNVLRAAPVPLYNSFEDVYRFVEVLSDCLSTKAT